MAATRRPDDGYLAREDAWPAPAAQSIDPRELELAQGTFNEVAVYEAIVRLAAVTGRAAGRPLHVLDVCAATGLAGHHAGSQIRVASMTLVDVDPEALGLARTRHERRWPELHLIAADAVQLAAKRRYDLIVANSAYHHIADDRKESFLRHLRDLLSPEGHLLIGDHFLPPYGPGDEERRRALRAFYHPLFSELRHRGSPDAAIAVVGKAFELALRGEVELKVSWDRFEHDASRAGLGVDEIVPIWDPGLARSGTKVVQLRAARG